LTGAGVVVRAMEPDELDRACAVVGRAFADNPSTLVNARGDRARAERMMRRVVRVAKLTRPYRRVLIADVDGDIVGVLNAAPWPSCQMTFAEQLRAAPALVRSLGFGLSRAARMMAARARHDPDEPHWHLGPIGVDAGRQGHGIGSMLLTAFLGELDTERGAAFLETDVDRNVELYGRFGFRVTSRERVLGVDTRFMSRAALR
jgi:ribosomal protein S18 acetylase RimI-like enzyme